MRESNRRQFMGSAVATAGLLGLGSTAAIGGTTTQTGERPAYADWVPDDTVVLNEGDELEVGSYPVSLLLDVGGAIGQADTFPLQFESLIYASFVSRAWDAVFQAGFGEAIFGPLSSQPPDEIDTANVPVQRHTNVGATSVYTGEFDTAAIEAVIEDGQFTETDREGIVEFETGIEDFTLFIAWGSEYFIVGEGLEALAAVRDAGTGAAQSRYEVDDAFDQLVTGIDETDFGLTRLAEDGTLAVTEYGIQLDYSSLEGVAGYATSVSFNSEDAQFDATTVALYPDEESVDTDRLGGMGTNALEQDLTTDGRSATVQASYDRTELGLDPDDGDDSADDSDDGTDGDDGTDDSSNDGDDSGGDDGNDGTESDSDTDNEDETDDADDNGAGFGVVAALSSLGGAGYLLSRRLDTTEKTAEGE